MKPSKELIERAAKAGFIWKKAYNEFIDEGYEHMRLGGMYGQDVYLSDGVSIDYDPIPIEEIMEAILEVESYDEE
jgi:hypothetical protein